MCLSAPLYPHHLRRLLTHRQRSVPRNLSSNLTFLFLVAWPVSSVIFFGVSIYISNVAGATLSWYSHLITSLAGSVTYILLTLGFDYCFDIYPVPFSLVTLFSLSCGPFLLAVYFLYPKSLRETPVFRKNVMIAFAILML